MCVICPLEDNRIGSLLVLDSRERTEVINLGILASLPDDLSCQPKKHLILLMVV